MTESYVPVVKRLREDHRTINELLDVASTQSKGLKGIHLKFKTHEEKEERYFLPILNRLEEILSNGTSTKQELIEVGEKAYEMLPYLDEIREEHRTFKKLLPEISDQRLKEKIADHIILEESVFIPLLRNIVNFAKDHEKRKVDLP
jgi:hypothetical protein